MHVLSNLRLLGTVIGLSASLWAPNTGDAQVPVTSQHVRHTLEAIRKADVSILRQIIPGVAASEQSIRANNPEFAWADELKKFEAEFRSAVQLERSDASPAAVRLPIRYREFTLLLTLSQRQEVLETRGRQAWVRLHFLEPRLAPKVEGLLLKARVFRLEFDNSGKLLQTYQDEKFDAIWDAAPPRILTVRVYPSGQTIDVWLVPYTKVATFTLRIGPYSARVPGNGSFETRPSQISMTLGLSDNQVRGLTLAGLHGVVRVTSPTGDVDSAFFSMPARSHGQFANYCFVRDPWIPNDPSWIRTARRVQARPPGGCGSYSSLTDFPNDKDARSGQPIGSKATSPSKPLPRSNISAVPDASGARARLAASPRRGEWVMVNSGSAQVRAWLSHPTTVARAPVVVVIHEAFGMTPWVRAISDQLAADGFIAIAPDLITSRGLPNSTDSVPPAQAMAAIRTLATAEVHKQISAVAEHAMGLPSALPRYGVLGFGWGGGVAFEHAVRSQRLAASVVYYGPPPPMASLRSITAPVLGLYASDVPTNATIPATEETMNRLGKVYEVHIYGKAQYAFLRTQQAVGEANLEAAHNAWPRTIDWLRKHINP